MFKSIKYRPEIDGLRGIAIILVLIYHARFYNSDDFFLKGGFLGVDIFFVISGYLMASIILSQVKKKNISHLKIFIKFFESRARRIWPAYFVLLLVCLLIFNYSFIGETLSGLNRSVKYSSVFLSNFHFVQKLAEYAAETSLNIPLLHTWSLSVEIQFYAIFPFIIFLTIKYLNEKYILVFGILSLLSIILATLITWNPYWNLISFYMMPTRLFELLAGATVFLIERNYNTLISLQNLKINYHLKKKICNFGSYLGVLILILSIIIFDNENRHPSFFTLFPIIGTSLLILFVKDNIFAKILSYKFIVSIGLISYSLYLWHFPIFSLSRRLQLIDESNVETKFILILISFILAIISYFIIERPFRNRNFISSKKFYYIFFISVIFLLSLNYYLNKQKNLQNFPGFIEKNVNKISWKDVSDGLGYCYGRSKIYCSWNWEYDHIPRIYVVGDSHMSVLEKDIVDYAINNKVGIKLITGRFYLPEFKLYQKSNSKEIKGYVDKIKKAETILTEINESNKTAGGNIVIYGSYFSSYLKGDQYVQKGVERKSKTFYQPIENKEIIFDEAEREKLILEGIKKSIEKILEKNYLVLVYPIPEAGILVGREFMNKVTFGNKFVNGLSFDKWIEKNKYLITSPYDVYLNRNKEIIDLFDSLDHPNLYKAYTYKQFCNNQVKDKCITHNDKTIFYHDRSHLSPDGASIANSSILEILDKIYSKFPGDYSEAMKAYDSGIGVRSGENLKDFIIRNKIEIKNKAEN